MNIMLLIKGESNKVKVRRRKKIETQKCGKMEKCRLEKRTICRS